MQDFEPGGRGFVGEPCDSGFVSMGKRNRLVDNEPVAALKGTPLSGSMKTRWEGRTRFRFGPAFGVSSIWSRVEPKSPGPSSRLPADPPIRRSESRARGPWPRRWCSRWRRRSGPSSPRARRDFLSGGGLGGLGAGVRSCFW